MKILQIESMGQQLITEDPFITCMHHVDHFPKGNNELGPAVDLNNRTLGQDFSGLNGFSMYHGKTIPGFPIHPHRGFETVTVVLEGIVDHFDSSGSSGRYSSGDVQWLTTGRGCQHAEMFPLLNMESDNPLELFQIWMNLPGKSKFVDPHYKMLWNEKIPIIEQVNTLDKKASIRLISGQLNSSKSLDSTPNSWASDTNNHVGIMLIEMDPYSTFILPSVSSSLNRNIYYYKGDGEINIANTHINSKNRIKLSGDEEITINNGDTKSYLLLLEGEPISEPVSAYGPFVMNTKKEIQEAYQDYRDTAFGGWSWSKKDPTHDRNTNRFSRFPDGRIELPK